ncbi:MAG: HAD family phosphatase [Lentisphaerae bacterium]|nr:HAD family phosphatase [Lentisphaerota bacterium]
MVVHHQTAGKGAARPQESVGFLFELENVLFPWRKHVFEVLRKALKKRDVDLSPGQFSRFCLSSSVEKFLPKLSEALDNKRLASEKLLTEVNEELDALLARKAVSLFKPVGELVEEARKRNFPVGVLSFLPEEQVQAVLVQFKLETAIPLMGRHGPTAHCGADCWLKLSRKLGVPAKRCLVFASTTGACRAALTGGMRCVVIPDEFTMFQDFSGADMVVEEDQALKFSEMMSLVRSCPFRSSAHEDAV